MINLEMQGLHQIAQISWESSSSDERESLLKVYNDETVHADRILSQIYATVREIQLRLAKIAMG
ncbi:hypothetical protein LCGC14_1924920 [marine sediment metagenome]|uniref:Uncharacterized protein n=1 Tax=marine sediment metagenome TaxID=412755 RepID=A0A0F9FQC1_9ZZZZ